MNAHGGQQVHGIHYWDTYTQTEFLNVYSDIKSQSEVSNEGPINKYLGVKVYWRKEDSMKLLQPLLTQQILEEMGLNQHTTRKTTPSYSSQNLGCDVKGSQK